MPTAGSTIGGDKSRLSGAQSVGPMPSNNGFGTNIAAGGGPASVSGGGLPPLPMSEVIDHVGSALSTGSTTIEEDSVDPMGDTRKSK